MRPPWLQCNGKWILAGGWKIIEIPPLHGHYLKLSIEVMVPDIRGLMVGVRVFLPITLELSTAATYQSLINVFFKIPNYIWPNFNMYLFSLQTVFLPITLELSTAATYESLINVLVKIRNISRFFLFNLQTVFWLIILEQHVKVSKMYLSKIQIIFVQISMCIC